MAGFAVAVLHELILSPVYLGFEFSNHLLLFYSVQ